jgi:hypothetical protein
MMGGPIPAGNGGFGAPVVGLALAGGSDIANKTFFNFLELNNLTCSYPAESVQASNKLLCVQQPMNDVFCFVDYRSPPPLPQRQIWDRTWNPDLGRGRGNLRTG